MVLKIEFSENHFHLTVKTKLWPRKFIFVPIFTSNGLWNWDCIERSSQTRKGRKRENDLANTQREKDRVVDCDLAFIPIAILRSTSPISPSPLPRDLTPRRTQSPLSLFLLSIWLDVMIFFFLGFVCVSVLRNEWYYVFVWQSRNCKKMLPDLMIFFLGFVCVSVLRNEWYYIFIWQLRKCEQQVENVFSIVFSKTQPNTRKYFSKHFLKCNQTHENIFLSEK